MATINQPGYGYKTVTATFENWRFPIHHVAGIIGKRLEEAGVDVLSVDLGKGDDGASVIKEVEKEKICLFIGSPVYVNRPVPRPEFGADCICCFQCVRNCPEKAILADLGPAEERIRGRAKQLNERPFTRI